MPKYKYQRKILRKKTINLLLTECEKNLIGGKKVFEKKEGDFFQIKVDPTMLQCLIALLWLFGKRIREVLKLKREDIEVREGFLYVNFQIQKKKSRKSLLTPIRKLKLITLKNPYTVYILNHIQTITNPDAWLFPGRKKKREWDVKWKDPETGEIIKTYHYVDDDVGRMSKEYALRVLKSLSETVCCHLFRHSLATTMAERKSTEEELMNWFDWDRYETAHGYVKGGPRMTKELSERTW